MKNILCLLTLFVIFLNKLDAQEKYILTGDYNNLTFNEFALKAEKEYGVKFFYRQSWVSDIHHCTETFHYGLLFRLYRIKARKNSPQQEQQYRNQKNRATRTFHFFKKGLLRKNRRLYFLYPYDKEQAL